MGGYCCRQSQIMTVKQNENEKEKQIKEIIHNIHKETTKLIFINENK
jgi:hypothetical protein